MAYNHHEIEKKWQERWETSGVFQAKDQSNKPKFYGLIEFPYPSGAGLHIGHPRSNTAMDIIVRKRRMQGFNVLYPIGWDAFGLPTENYAIKTGRKPEEVTRENIDTFRRQLKSLGFSFDWSREVSTTDPEYYKWTQWMFLEFFKAGLAYKAKMPINWCLSCKIGLANEEVVDGMCERCGGATEKREKEQWMIAITKYADRLLEDLETVNYLEKIKIQQRNWIGRSEGVNWKQKIKDLDIVLEAYDSVPQTFMAQTFAVIAPEHPLLKTIVAGTPNEKEVMEYARQITQKKAGKGFEVDKEVDGIFTGRYLDNPFGTGDLPIWVASFVVMDYGTGFVNCSAHDERDFDFAKKYNIPLRPVMFPVDAVEAEKVKNLEVCYHHDPEAIMQAPAPFVGRKWGEVREEIISYVVEQGFGERAVNYKLRDWVFSRQRYWGEPIPLVSCEKCGWVPLPDNQLPLILPDVEKYEPTDTGESPLAAMTDWVNTTCPTCAGPAKRETDTMPNWAGSSWYFLRYIDPHNNDAFALKEKLSYWMPVDWYNGGMEHTTLHLLYSRFWNKFLFDRGYVTTSEPYAKRTSHGLILASDGTKMSKSKGNVVNPDEVVSQYGADAVRLYQMFMGPFAEPVPWSVNGLIGMRRFLDKVTALPQLIKADESVEVTRCLHQTIKKVSDDIENMRFNTAVSQMMIFVNTAKEYGSITKDSFKTFLYLLCPFAPHLANELQEGLGEEGMLEEKTWPEFDAALAKEEMVEIGVQVSGKVRGTITLSPETQEADALELANANANIARHLEGKEVVKVIYVAGKILNIVVK
ncbi:MAG: leucine--tRNA ligase [Patescibacteria group bacterium]